MVQDGKFYLCVSSPTIKDKPVSFSIQTDFVDMACTYFDMVQLVQSVC